MTVPDGLRVEFFYSIGDLFHFNTLLYIQLPLSENKLNNVLSRSSIQDIILNLGVIEGLNYWKLTASSEYKIAAGYLSTDQLTWWKTVLLKGMSEYFFQNKINFTQPDFVNLTCLVNGVKGKQSKPVLRKISDKSIKTLVPIGGGKDSIVTYEQIKDKRTVGLFRLDPNMVTRKMLKKIQEKSSKTPIIIATRKLDSQLKLLQEQSFLKGHVPYTTYTSFLSLLVAELLDYDEIAFSNERSAEEENTVYLGQKINHQWAKTLDFENMFRDYMESRLFSKVTYYSLLRPLYELQVMKLFSKYENYFSVFSSCNVPQKQSNIDKPNLKPWCGKCAKCLFAYSLLYPFIERKKIIELFGHDLFADDSLVQLMDGLIGKEIKPFDCVGTSKESMIAFNLCLQKAKKEQVTPVLLKKFEERVNDNPSFANTLEKITKEVLTSYGSDTNIPKDLAILLKSNVHDAR